MVKRVFREVPRPKPEGPQAQGVFLLRDFLRDSIHNDTPKAFTHILILLSSRTSKERFLSAMDSLRSIMVNVCS